MYSREQRLEEWLEQVMVYLEDYEMELQEMAIHSGWCPDEANKVRSLIKGIKAELESGNE